jgi:hypothetical protein
VIGLPLDVTFPRLKGISWRYCTRWDEGPAAVLGMSTPRLGICRPDDWSGSAVDFVEPGFRRFCSKNRAADVKKVWVGDLRITDSLFELTEQERNQVEAGREGMTDHLYLVGDYEAAASKRETCACRRLPNSSPNSSMRSSIKGQTSVVAMDNELRIIWPMSRQITECDFAFFRAPVMAPALVSTTAYYQVLGSPQQPS